MRNQKRVWHVKNDVFMSMDVMHRLAVSTSQRVWPMYFALSLAGCTAATQPSIHDDAGSDQGTAPDTDSDSWDTDEPGLNVLSSTRIFSTADGNVESLGAATDGTRLAVSVSYDNNGGETDGLYLLTFPAEDPLDATVGFYPPITPACPDLIGGGKARPHAIAGGFRTLAGAIAPTGEGCDVTSAEWSATADLTGGPYSIDTVSGIFDPAYISKLHGDPDDTGSIIVLRLIIRGGSIDYPVGSEIATFQMDVFGGDGAHETLFGPTDYPWSDQYPETGNSGFPFYQRTFVRDGLVSVIAPTSVQDESNQPIDQSLVIAQSTLAGSLTAAPHIAHRPPEKEGYPINHGVHAFAAKEDEILAASLVVYDDGTGSCASDRYSVRFSLAGEQLADPSPISSSSCCENADGETFAGDPALEWSGLYYGYCDLEQTEEGVTYSFWVLDALGAFVAGPQAFFPPVTSPWGAVDSLIADYHCDVVPLTVDTFAIVFSTPENVPELTDGPGVYVAYTKYVEID